jgi:hypothetical protein
MPSPLRRRYLNYAVEAVRGDIANLRTRDMNVRTIDMGRGVIVDADAWLALLQRVKTAEEALAEMKENVSSHLDNAEEAFVRTLQRLGYMDNYVGNVFKGGLTALVGITGEDDDLATNTTNVDARPYANDPVLSAAVTTQDVLDLTLPNDTFANDTTADGMGKFFGVDLFVTERKAEDFEEKRNLVAAVSRTVLETDSLRNQLLLQEEERRNERLENLRAVKNMLAKARQSAGENAEPAKRKTDEESVVSFSSKMSSSTQKKKSSGFVRKVGISN